MVQDFIKLVIDLIRALNEANSFAGFFVGFVLALAVVFLVRNNPYRLRTSSEINLEKESDSEEKLRKQDQQIAELSKKQEQLEQELYNEQRNHIKIQERLLVSQEQLLESQEQLRYIETIRHALIQNDDELWTYHPAKDRQDSMGLANQKCKVFVVANNKGGVAKSTLTTCLAAFFSKIQQARVLIMDLDHQGSTSITMVREANMNWPGSDVLKETFARHPEYERCIAMSCDLNHIMPGSRLITSSYDLQRFENRLMLQWLLEEQKDDARFRLAKFLASPAVNDRFDVVIIDTGPRLTMCSVAAMTAAHYLLVPTIPDRMSVEATGNFLIQARSIFRESEINPNIKLLGVIKTITSGNSSEEDAFAYLHEQVNKWTPGAHIFDNEMKRNAGFSDYVGTNNPYLRDRRARNIIDPIGNEIKNRIYAIGD